MIHYFSLDQFSKENPCAVEILKAFSESRRYLLNAVKEGVKDGTIRDDIDPFLISMYLTVASMSILSMTDDWKQIVEQEGFSYETFVKEFGRFITPAVDKQAGKKKPHVVEVKGFEAIGYFIQEPIVVEPIPRKKNPQSRNS